MQSRRLLVALKLYLLVALVGSLVVLGGPGPEPAEGAFRGENGKIAFTTNRDGGNAIYVMNPDGSDQTRLTFSAADAFPAWSRSGAKIAFQSTRDGNEEIYVMNADGSDQTNLTNNAAKDGQPAWSPDGGKVAFHSDRDGDFEIYVMKSDGSDVQQLTVNTALDNSDFDALPAWSPDGSKIAFATNRHGSDSEIYIMDASNGMNPTRLTNSTGGRDVLPNWSPDGLKIAFESSRDGDEEIYVMNSEDGSNQTNLTNYHIDETDDSFPVWSPDGLKIAFASEREGGINEIFVMNADGTVPVNVSNNPAIDHFPDWGPLTSIGGIAELPEVAAEPLEAGDSSGPSASVLAGVVVAIMAGAVALGGATWYARRRRGYSVARTIPLTRYK